MAAATIKAAGTDRPDLERYAGLARGVVNWIQIMRGQFIIDELAVCIETPVLNSTNVTNYRKQVSTVALIEFMAMGVAGLLIEVNPTEVKVAATGHGNAKKKDIVKASPFTGTGPSVEAIADAWAVAVAGRQHQSRGQRPRLRTEYGTHSEEIL